MADPAEPVAPDATTDPPAETEEVDRPDVELIYVGDPMCSWCWGFAPVISEIRASFDVPIRLIVGGLRPGPASRPLTPDLAQVLAQHWEEVAEASGQPFDPAFFDRTGFVYDTEPADVAVVAGRRVAPSLALDWMERLQRAFYAENVDITDPSVYPDLAAEVGIDRAAFEAAYEDEATREEAWRDFAITQAWGITGFPAVVLRDGDALGALARGWVSADQLADAFEEWLRNRFDEEVVSELVTV